MSDNVKFVIETPHTSGICSFACSNNSRLLTAGSRDGTITIYETATFRRTHHLRPGFNLHEEDVMVMIFSHDDTLLVSTSSKTTTIWKISTGKMIQQLRGHTCNPCRLCISHDHSIVVCISDEGEIIFWRTLSGEIIHRYRDLTGFGYVSNMFISRDDSFIVTSAFQDVTIWKTTTGEIIRQLSDHTGFVKQVCLSSDDCYLWSADREPKMRVFEVSTGKCVSLEKPPWAKECSPPSKSADNRFRFYKENRYDKGLFLIKIEIVTSFVEERKSEETRNPASEVLSFSEIY